LVAVALAEEVKDIPGPVKILGGELRAPSAIFRRAERYWEPTARTAGLRSNTGHYSNRAEFAAPTTAGAMTRAGSFDRPAEPIKTAAQHSASVVSQKN